MKTIPPKLETPIPAIVGPQLSSTLLGIPRWEALPDSFDLDGADSPRVMLDGSEAAGGGQVNGVFLNADPW